MANDKLGLPSKERKALLRNQVSHLLWYGKLETTEARAKSVRSEAEKLLTLAIKTYEDTAKVVKTIKDPNSCLASNAVQQNLYGQIVSDFTRILQNPAF